MRSRSSGCSIRKPGRSSGRTAIALGVVLAALPAAMMSAQPLTHEVPVPIGPAGFVAPQAPPSTGITHETATPLSPTAGTSFDMIDFDQDGTLNGFNHIPPDPIGAAGPSHVVCVVNTSIAWGSKTGSSITRQALSTFNSSLSPVNNGFDPKVIYDQHASRFVVVTLERTDDDDGSTTGDADDTSRILVAVSATSDPTGSWHFTAINSKITIGGVDRWADYPGFAVDEEAVYITNNMFAFGSGGGYGGGRLWIIEKTDFYAGNAAVVTVHDPYTASGGFEMTSQPAHIFGSGSSLPGGSGASEGTWLVGYSGLTDGTNDFFQAILIDDPLGTPSFTLDASFISMGNVDDNSGVPTLLDAPQPTSSTGLSLIEVNDRRALHAVWRNGFLYATTTIAPPSGADVGETTAHWVKLSTSSLTDLTLSDQGNIGGENIETGAYTYFPSIAVNNSEDVAVCFALSAPSTNAGGYYASRKSSDTAGTMSDAVAFAAGASPYRRTFGGTRNRWGDYSGISVDPSDDETFWAFNQYAKSGTDADTEDGEWGTKFGSFWESVPVELDVFEVM